MDVAMMQIRECAKFTVVTMFLGFCIIALVPSHTPDIFIFVIYLAKREPSLRECDKKG